MIEAEEAAQIPQIPLILPPPNEAEFQLGNWDKFTVQQRIIGTTFICLYTKINRMRAFCNLNDLTIFDRFHIGFTLFYFAVAATSAILTSIFNKYAYKSVCCCIFLNGLELCAYFLEISLYYFTGYLPISMESPICFAMFFGMFAVLFAQLCYITRIWSRILLMEEDYARIYSMFLSRYHPSLNGA